MLLKKKKKKKKKKKTTTKIMALGPMTAAMKSEDDCFLAGK